MSTIATAVINWNQLWQIVLAAFIGGTGVVIVFGVLLLGISRGKSATRPATAYALYTLSGLCLVVVVGVGAVGVYAMTQKPPAARAKPKTATTTRAPASALSSRPTRGNLGTSAERGGFEPPMD
jgi:NADH:ubiquinone oxidoreductase subunit 6 (subunit J)